jgi:hypothetical protein
MPAEKAGGRNKFKGNDGMQTQRQRRRAGGTPALRRRVKGAQLKLAATKSNATSKAMVTSLLTLVGAGG